MYLVHDDSDMVYESRQSCSTHEVVRIVFLVLEDARRVEICILGGGETL